MINNENLIKQSIPEVIDFLKKEKIQRFFIVPDLQNGKLITSHKVLQPIADFIQSDKRDFMNHEGIFIQLSSKYDILLGAFIHNTTRGQAAGGVRYWNYNDFESYLRDGLRLAKGMTRKNALSGIWWGGGKGVIAHNTAFNKNNHELRQLIYQEFGKLMSSLRGCYITAEDVGTNVSDMKEVFSQTRFTTCIPENFGGSGNPSVPTARGVVSAMEAALNFHENGTLKGKTIAVQGTGNVGGPLIKFLFEKDVKKVIASDINSENLNKLKEYVAGQNIEIYCTESGDNSILFTECDILAPCATGGILNSDTIPKIKAKIVCGAANNQLYDSIRDDYLLFESDICYVPDFIVNRMGIVSCANEQYGYVNNDNFIERHLDREWEHSIYQTIINVLNYSKLNGIPPGKTAIELADKEALISHPITGHRGKKIINSLVQNDWHLNINSSLYVL